MDLRRDPLSPSHALPRQITAVLCIGIGFYSIYRNKELHGKPHFTSYHGMAGAAVLAATVGTRLGCDG